MHPSFHARIAPEKPAIIMGESGSMLTFSQLDALSNRAAHLFRASGLQVGDTVALLLENHPLYFALCWGAQRSGLYYVCMSSRLTLTEALYILRDSEAKLLLTSAAMQPLARQLRDRQTAEGSFLPIYMLDGAPAGFEDLNGLLEAQPETPIVDERAGTDMLYSSGTTGRPKGIKLPLPENPAIDASNGLVELARALYSPDSASVYLSPAPLYHAAPLRWSMAFQRLGVPIVVMEHFDAEHALAMIERYKVTHAQFVPTHFVRMLKLPPGTRRKYDVGSLQCVIHAAAPCPVPVKQAMIDWWGPILNEYYAGTEGSGLTHITTGEWIARPGSVGRALVGIVHIMADDGETELTAGQEGMVYFESPAVFEYHNDAEKTLASRNSRGWTTLGDIGRLDSEGYLTLTDRKAYMIISGGVNIYPQEIENRLITHPAVIDAAVIGAPDDDYGERVVAVIEAAAGVAPDDKLRSELEAWCRVELSGIKVPRQIDFVDTLPRHPTGKLYKRLLRDRYWGKS